MTTLIIPDDVGKRLLDFAEKAHLSKDEYATQVLEEFLEDQEDYLIALVRSERIEKGIDKALPFEDLIEEYKRSHGAKKMGH